MRTAGIVTGVIAVLFVLGLLAVELAATSLASSAARSEVERCVEVEQVEVTSLGRPAVLGLLRGEVRDVRITAIGIEAGDLRIDRVDARLPVAPVGLGDPPETLTVVADIRIVEEDLERYLVARAPELAAPTLAVTPEGLEIGDERVPFTLGANVLITEDGDVRLVPTIGDPRLWSSLGLELVLEVPRDVALLGLELSEGELVLSTRTQVHAGVDGELTCPDVALLGTGGVPVASGVASGEGSLA